MRLGATENLLPFVEGRGGALVSLLEVWMVSRLASGLVPRPGLLWPNDFLEFSALVLMFPKAFLGLLDMLEG